MLNVAFAPESPATAVISTAGTGPVVKAVLGVLIVMSVLTWAIVAAKMWRRRQVLAADRRFLEAFYKSRELTEIRASARAEAISGAARLFLAAHDELETVRRHLGEAAREQLTHEGLGRLVERALDRAMLEVRLVREQYLIFLATTASGAPFIGLFGTVWGIMSAFADIGRMGSASLAVVAPGISEALIATAVGLGAAIPASWFYNFQQRQIETEAGALAGFRLELLNLFEAFVFPDFLAHGRAAKPSDGTLDR
jgi:biopolymer transport protein TolQ